MQKKDKQNVWGKKNITVGITNVLRK